MKIAVVTTMNKKLYRAYGHKFFETYNWPFDCFVYHEDNFDEIIDTHSYGTDGITPFFYRSILNEVPSCVQFVDRNYHRQPRSSFEEKGLDFITDGVRFCYKVYAYTDVIMKQEYDGVIGIDADSIFYNDIDVDWIKKHIHRDDIMMAHLGRGDHYSECGFLYWNLKHKDTMAYAARMKGLYDTDGIYHLKEQHDSFVWDYARKEFEARGTKNHNIGDGKPGHVQSRSILGDVYDHTKGPRKLKGRSPEARVK
jgi:hypothetical protein